MKNIMMQQLLYSKDTKRNKSKLNKKRKENRFLKNKRKNNKNT